MKKVLITGMSAPQVSQSSNNRSLSFAGVLQMALTGAGYSVTWGDPKITLTESEIKRFDKIFVGLSPLTSLGANRVYGALGTIESVLRHDTSKLALFVDAPNVQQIEVSLRAVASAPETLVKDFYSYRKEYVSVKSSPAEQERLLSVVNRLLDEPWPTTIYPKLPWQSDLDVAARLPEAARESLVGVNLDAHILVSPISSEEKVDKWVASDSKSVWTQKLLKTVGMPCSPVRLNKGSNDTEAQSQIARSVGVIIAPDKKKFTWWDYVYIQAMNSLTPIATRWQESYPIGNDWSVLASEIESSDSQRRREIALGQRKAYIANIPDKIESITLLEKAVGLK